MRRDMPSYGYDFPIWGHLAGLILFLLFLTAIGLLIALLVRQTRPGRHRGKNAAATPPLPGQPPVPGAPHPAGAMTAVPMDALRILDERLARGDIDVADYAARRRALTGEPDAPRPTPPPASPDETRIDPSI